MFYPPLPLPDHSPFELATRRHRPRRADKAMLVSLIKQIEQIAGPAGRSTIILSAFQEMPGISVSNLDRSDPLCTEWTMIMLGPRRP